MKRAMYLTTAHAIHSLQSSSGPVQSPTCSSYPAAPVPSYSSPASAAPFVERRNAQLGSIYIPPVTTVANSSNNAASNPATVTSASSPLAQLAKAPMPWMNSQNRANTSPPPFLQERVDREDQRSTASAGSSHSSGNNVRVIPIAIEGRPSTIAPSRGSNVSAARDESSSSMLSWQDNQGNKPVAKIIPIHLESGPPSASVNVRPQNPPEQAAPWRTQAANNANQIAAMMEE